MHRLCVNTIPFYIRDLSFLRIWCPGLSWNQGPEDTEGWLYCVLEAKNGSPRCRAPTCHTENLLQLTGCHPHLYLQIAVSSGLQQCPSLGHTSSLSKSGWKPLLLDVSVLRAPRWPGWDVLRAVLWSDTLPACFPVIPHGALHCRLKVPTSRVPAKTDSDLSLCQILSYSEDGCTLTDTPRTGWQEETSVMSTRWKIIGETVREDFLFKPPLGRSPREWYETRGWFKNRKTFNPSPNTYQEMKRTTGKLPMMEEGCYWLQALNPIILRLWCFKETHLVL